MLHVYLPVSRDRALEIRDAIALEHGVWLFGGAQNGPLPEQSYFECYVGDGLLNLPDDRVREILALFSDALTEG